MSESRLRLAPKDGPIGEFAVRENLLLINHADAKFLTNGMFNFSKIKDHCQQLVDEFDVKSPSLNTPTSSLSGGNIGLADRIAVTFEGRIVKIVDRADATREGGSGSPWPAPGTRHQSARNSRTMRLIGVCFVLVIAGCASSAAQPDPSAASDPPTPTTTSILPEHIAARESATESTTTSTPATTTTVDTRSGTAAPAWLGTRLLPLRPGEDNGVAQPTPAELVDRQLWTTDTLVPPTDDVFVSNVTSPPPADVVVRSTWREECPVRLDELAYAQVSFFGFDGLFHTGEFMSHVDHVDGLVDIFAELHATRFPIEEMVVTTQEAVDAHPTGDSNNTSSFVCRPAVNSGAWSRHAHGGAIDINPFHNPYVKGDLVIPELADVYLDRGDQRTGMVTASVVERFAEMGWGWGGNWNSASDWMHFSDTGG